MPVKGASCSGGGSQHSFPSPRLALRNIHQPPSAHPPSLWSPPVLLLLPFTKTEWSDVANDWIRRNVPDLDLDRYPTKVYVVPRGRTCAWGGMGYVGCRDDCRVWIQGDLWAVRRARVCVCVEGGG